MNGGFPLYWSYRKGLAFLRRDFLFESSYRLQGLVLFMGPLFAILNFYFLSQIIGGNRSQAHLEPYGGDYFTFALVGVSFVGFFNAGIMRYTSSIRQQLTIGVLEAMAVSPTRSLALLFYSILWPLAYELVKAFLFLLTGVLCFGAQIQLTNAPLLLIALALSLLVFGSLGIIAASLIIYLKRGDPVAWALTSLSVLVGGVVFPVSLLPTWLAWIARLVPITYALDAFRACLIPTAAISNLRDDFLTLGAFAAVLGPTAMWSAHVIFEKARVDGNLGHY